MIEAIIQAFMWAAIVVISAVFSMEVVKYWGPAAKRRGGTWELEAMLFLCGPIAATLVSLYPSDHNAGGPGFLGTLNRVCTDASYALALIGIVRGLTLRKRKATGLLLAVVAYYFALILSGIGGVVPGIPEAYWLVPILVLAFVLNESCTLQWFLGTARVALRAVVVLSLLSMILRPEIAFNLDDTRAVFGFRRLKGITPHPNMLALVTALGFFIELQSRGRLRHFWRLSMLVSVLLAQSSMGYIAAAVGALFVVNRLSRFARWALIAGAPVGALAAIFNEELASELSKATSAEEITRALNGRTGIWDAALQGFHLNPWFGYGPSLLDDEYRALYLPNFGVGTQAHNQWFQSLGEGGILGAATLIALGIALFFYGCRGRITSKGLSLAAPAVLFVGCVSESPLRPAGLSLGTMAVIIVTTIVVLAQNESRQAAPDVDSEADQQPLEIEPLRVPRTSGVTRRNLLR